MGARVDNRQFRDIVDEFGDMVYRIALNQTRQPADAEDIVQTVFLKLYAIRNEKQAARPSPGRERQAAAFWRGAARAGGAS